MDSWKDWTPEQWRNAVFCPDCGLPLLEVEDEDPWIGHYMCVFCAWVEDIEDVHKSKIAGLEAEVDRLRDERRWIPVGERLPENINPVLVTDGGHRIAQGNYINGKWVAFSDGFYLYPTHWQPLPEPPEVE